MMISSEKILQINNLKTCFFTEHGIVKSVDGISFYLNKGEVLGVVGESGCGKTMTALSLIRLVNPPGKIVGGEILFNGMDLMKLSELEIQHIRGKRISMVFQEPMTALNPVFRVGEQIAEMLRTHLKYSRKDAINKTIELLQMVGIPAAEKRIMDYPHQLSGGMRQRIMIAMAISCKPDIVIMDEPTTALDVTIQAQILDLIMKLKEDLGMAIIMITHNLGVIAEIAKRVIVMYAGKIVEEADTMSLFEKPSHPYTQSLLKAIPTFTDEIFMETKGSI